MNNVLKPETAAKSLRHRIGNITGIILMLMLVPIFCINLSLLWKSWTNTNEVPSFGGWLPMIVLTDSMQPELESGDLIFCQTLDPEQVKIGDTISFFDPAGNGSSVVTHKVIDITRQEGELAFQTQGTANNTADDALVPASSLVGIYRRRIPGAGNIVLFMQTTQGLILCAAVPLALLVLYDFLRRRQFEKQNELDTQALLNELNLLRAQQVSQKV